MSLNKYKCNWPNCGHEFERRVNATQIKCPNCGNFLKTWSEK